MERIIKGDSDNILEDMVKSGEKFDLILTEILDPFLGSGTTGVCCEKLNSQGHQIQWLGIELEQKWIDIANERLEKNLQNFYMNDNNQLLLCSIYNSRKK